MPRFFGHKQGVDALVRTVLACADRGIEYVTVFAFSSENWKRPTEEVSGPDGPGAGRGVEVPGQAGRRRRAHPHRRRSQPGLRQASRRLAAGRILDLPQHPHHAVGGVQLRRPLGHRPGLPAGDRRRHRARTNSTRRAELVHGAQLRARSGSLHPHRRRGAHQQLPALAGGLLGARLQRLPLARVRRGRARRGAGRVRASRAPLRHRSRAARPSFRASA